MKNNSRFSTINSPLPKGWDLKKIAEIGTVFNGNSINAKVKKEKYTNLEEGLPYIATKDISYESVIDYDNGVKIPDEDKSSFKIASQNTVLICAEGGSSGRKIAFTDQEVCFGNKLFALSTTDKVNSRFVYYYYFSSQFQEDFASQLTGIIGGVSMAKFKKLKVPLPSPPEQQRIVEILDKAFVAIDKAKQNMEQNLRNAKEVFESYLQNMFEDKVCGTRYETLNNLCELIVDCEHKTAPIQGTGYPSIRTPNIGKGELLLAGVNRVSHEVYLQWTRRAIPKENDLILAREAPAGNIAVIPKNIDVCLGQRTVLIRPKDDKFISKYLAYLILSKKVQEELLSHSTGATVQHINMKDIRAFKIFNLSSIQQQQEIVKKLDELSGEIKKIETIYQQKLDNLTELKKSILQKAFRGEL